jgi:glycosyltransferase involved in cell wall biosynthesis
MARVYSSADILVVPSLADNLPNVIMEALACGVPTAGFRVGGIPEMVVEGQTGCLAGELSSTALAAAMLRLLADVAASREAWRNRCREYACEHFSLKTQAARYKKLYESLLATG